MLSFNTTSRLQQMNSAIPTSPVIALQAAFFRLLTQDSGTKMGLGLAGLPASQIQEIALAPKIAPGHALAERDLPKLAGLMFEAYTAYVRAYAAAGLPDPERAALHAMQSYEVICT